MIIAIIIGVVILIAVAGACFMLGDLSRADQIEMPLKLFTMMVSTF